MIDYIVENMLKQQLLNVYATFEKHPEYLRDPDIKSGYQRLLNARTVQKFNDRVKLINASRLSLIASDNIEPQTNALGILADTAAKATDEAIASFVS